MATLLSEFKSITEALNDAGIEYAVCGGWAMAIHGLPRATMDIDLLVLADDLEMIRRIAKDRGYDVEGLPLHFDDGAIETRRISKIDSEAKRLFTLDLLLVTPKLQEPWSSREQVEWEEGQTWVVGKAGLIELTRISGREQDLLDIEVMVDISPSGVTGRLRLMDELWELSIKLMNSTKVSAHETSLDHIPADRNIREEGSGHTSAVTARLRMGGRVVNEGLVVVGEEMVLDGASPTHLFATFFEDDGETGYFYAVDRESSAAILDALHIYNVSNISDASLQSRVQIRWSTDGLKSALVISDEVHAVFDFDANRGYCRSGFPPTADWSKDGHAWSDEAIRLFD